ncbi:SpoIIE family protein phosphatase [Streptomyces kunmingensis]|uniref:SpoIIE family protein phosphatase n=1 Tax=Streptomyces kunmingensis TaxID=68225 RepID=A0ABU6CA32_9ACTN|nr:SpoIIE family protein phosphatase [Streptomyces kunmingensis]MEB3961568.1 SpoIIE family protein phosphatase [Streptomyces kunmingensis]
MSCTGPGPEEAGGGTAPAPTFADLLEDSPEDLYDNAPCGYLSTLMDGTIVKLNDTLLGWLGLERKAIVGQLRFTDLLPVGGRLYHETHFAPLLRMQGEISGVALELKRADGARLPVLVSGVVKYGSTGTPLLTRITVFDATDRRAYETELLRSRKAAEESARQARADRARLQQALAVLQQSLLPSTLPEIPGMEAAGYYHTASPDRLGGDFYDVFPLDDRRFAFFLGDVCGKGPEAAAVTSLTRYTLRAAALHDPDPVAALTTLNQVLHERYSGVDPRFCTAIFGVLEPSPDTGHVTVLLASGGHPPALVLRAAGTADFLHTPGGLLVGALPDPRFSAATTTLAPGDTLLLYTDGVIEARTGPDRSSLFGDEALRAFTAEHAGSARTVIAALSGLLSGLGDGLDDDTALLALGVPTPASTSASTSAPTPKNTP